MEAGDVRTSGLGTGITPASGLDGQRGPTGRKHQQDERSRARPTATTSSPHQRHGHHTPDRVNNNMSETEDLINFDVIEGQKENIQSLPGGRSARALANLFSPSPSPRGAESAHEATRQAFEAEVQSAGESDDPLDAWERYVRWTLETYPSAQGQTSGLAALLERATRAFLGVGQYRNDPRYLKLWLAWVRFFADAPRETYAFLARHGVGDGLALFYEEFAAWLEGAGRWAQADEVYRLGIEREARPAARLLRKYSEFQQRYALQPQDGNEPSSPALPTVRPALAAKIDPFATSRSSPVDPQAPRPNPGIGGSSAPRNGRPKLAIFSDADGAAPKTVLGGEGVKGWETIGSLAERKKENRMEPKPWAGETLKAGGKSNAVSKMMVFKDQVSRFSSTHAYNMLMITGLMNGGITLCISVSTTNKSTIDSPYERTDNCKSTNR